MESVYGAVIGTVQVHEVELPGIVLVGEGYGAYALADKVHREGKWIESLHLTGLVLGFLQRVGNS